jgi:hypothetical protein
MWQIEGSKLATPKLGTPTNMPNLMGNNYILNIILKNNI